MSVDAARSRILLVDDDPGVRDVVAFTLRRPIGVIGAISPFNFPCNLVAHKLAPALAAGRPVPVEPGVDMLVSWIMAPARRSLPRT